MKLKCTYSHNDIFTVGNIYEGEFSYTDECGVNWYQAKNNTGTNSKILLDGWAWNFEIVEEEKMEKMLTGLEAIELMKQGKIVTDENENHQFKIVKGNVCFKPPYKDDSEYRVDMAFEFNIKYKEYIDPKPLTGWEKLDEYTDNYFAIITCGDIWEQNKYFGVSYNSCYDSANAFSTEEKAEEINFKQTLFRKLQRFSDENGGNEIDWSDAKKRKFFIFYCSDSKELDFYWNYTDKDFGHVYFISKEVAEKAIELFHDDLIKYFTEFN